jgi:hypothetical protein
LNTLVNFRPAQPSKTDQFSAGANTIEKKKPPKGYNYPQLAAVRSAKAPGQNSTGTGGQNSTGANIPS